MRSEWIGDPIDHRKAETPPTVEEWHPLERGRSPAVDDADDGPIAYRTTVVDPRASETERALLTVRGSRCVREYGGGDSEDQRGDARAAVWFNGDYLGDVTPSFVPTRFAVDPRPENELIIVADAPGRPSAGDEFADGTPAPTPTPPVRWDVDLDARPQTMLRRVTARPQLDGTGGAETETRSSAEPSRAAVDVTIEIDAGEAVDDAITLVLRPEGGRGGATMERVPVSVASGERSTISRSITVRDPSLWWPRGYGPQHRYTVRAKLGGDAVERTVGFRRVDRDDDGLLVNGTRVRARGFTRLSSGAAREDVERAVDANATLVRARGHVPSQAFYTACDEAGLLVWQDLPGSTAASAGVDHDPDRRRELAAELVRAYEHHPSLSLYCTQDGSAEKPFADPLASGRLAKLAFRYRAWRASATNESAAAAEAVPTDLPVLPVVGPPGTDPTATELAPGWRYLEAADSTWLFDRYPSLADTVGAVTAGSLASSASAPGSNADSIEELGVDAALLERQLGDGGAENGSDETTAHDGRDGRSERDEENGDGRVERSQASQARTLKTVVEAVRRRDCGIYATAPLRDVDPGGGTGVLTAAGEPKPAYRALADALEPVQAVLDGPAEPRSVGITLCNDTQKQVSGTVRWQAGEETGETTVTADPLTTTAAGVADVPPETTELLLETALDDRLVHNRYSL